MVMLKIKEMVHDDLPFFCEVRNSCAREFLHNPNVFTQEETVEWFDKTRPKYFIIYHNEEKIGYFRTSNHDEIQKTIYIGCDIQEKYRNKGYGFSSYNLFINKIFNDFDLAKIQLEVLSTNYVAKKLYTKLGFEQKPERSVLIKRMDELVTSEFWELEKYKFFNKNSNNIL